MAGRRSLLLVGTGLVGGSFALAAKAAGVFDHVVGVDLDPKALAEAVARGAVDEAGEPAAAEGCAAACVAVPVAGIAPCVRQVAAKVPVVFDVGSVKQPVIDALAPPPHFVPCHPIAGAAGGGVGAARADLFRDRTVVLTPTDATDRAALDVVRGYWRAVGGRVVVERAEEHDRRLAMLSHLPHLLAFAYVEVAEGAGDLAGAGSGFRDFTRIAGADAQVWADILHANADAVLAHLDELMAALGELSEAMRGDREALRARIAAAARVRRALEAGGL